VSAVDVEKGALLLALTSEHRTLFGREPDCNDKQVFEMFMQNPTDEILDDGTYRISAETFRRFCSSQSLCALRRMGGDFAREFEEKGPRAHYFSAEMINILMMRLEVSVRRIITVDFEWVSPNLSLNLLQCQDMKHVNRGGYREMLTKKLSGNRVLLPYGDQDHWSLFEILNSEKRIQYYDCNRGHFSEDYLRDVFDKIYDILSELSIAQPEERWTFLDNVLSPQQRNGEDCGVFVLYFVALRMLDRWTDHDDLQTQRLRMTLAKGLIWQSRS